ncbi:MAG: DUF6114 domain-containing protein [Candidatus Nitrosotenuis sp.]
MAKTKKSNLLYVGLSLIAGIIIVASGFVLSVWHFAVFPHFDLMMGPSTLTGQSSMITSSAIIITGAIIIAMAVVMYKQPNQSSIWGLVTLFFSALSILEMGGFIIGGIIGIVGSSLAISDRKKIMHDVRK